MVFSSSVFMFAFLPIALGLYFLMPGRAVKNVWLLIVSLAFYAWGEPVYVILMITSILVNWAIALCMAPDSARTERFRKLLLVIACVFNILVIGFFKYEGFIAENINTVIGMQLVPDLDLPLPIGISFYTLQTLSYVIDVYRGDVPPQRNLLYLGMYVSCFPQLIAGPIVRYQTIQEQVLNRKENLDDFSSGLRLFIVGLGKKVLLANVVAILATKMLSMGGPSIGVVGAWGGLIAYAFQIFFDFSGYSDMAIGLGRMMGFKYLRNFNYPYVSKSAGEFWRRWHISLYTFFKDYIYIPLGGSRVTACRWIFNTAIVWTITGLWHGAAWNYILWGVYYGVILICEKQVWGTVLSKLPAPVRHIYTIIVFMFGWLIFWITDMSAFGPYLAAMFGAYGLTGTSTFWDLTVWEYIPVFAACTLASVPLVPWLKERVIAWVEERKPRSVFGEQMVAHPKTIQADKLCVVEVAAQDAGKVAAMQAVNLLVDVFLLAVMGLACASIISGSFNPFIYFQF